ncbi:hypothetical protein [Methylomonas sp. HYX-M1]|uniref:hypothetical protein n=1 Tax=Methylomonas sp. HYX-M1 TaxID=3139307 RepID=UPI00345B71FB
MTTSPHQVVSTNKSAVLKILNNIANNAGTNALNHTPDSSLVAVLTIEHLFQHDTDITDAAFAARSHIEALCEQAA